MRPCLQITLGVIGVALIAFGFALGYGIFPAVRDKLVKEELDLRNLESEGRKNFMTPPVPVHMKFYLYHVNNPEEATKGAKPNITERGPYAYKEIREKRFVSDQDCTIQAAQYKAYVFDPDASCQGCTKDDKVTVINAPLIGFVTVLRSKKGLFPILNRLDHVIKEGYFTDKDEFNEDYKDTLFITTGVEEFIFSGYKHGVIRWAIETQWSTFSGSMPPVIKEANGFAVFNGKNDTVENEFYELDNAYCNSENVSNFEESDMLNYLAIRRWGPSMEKLKTDLNASSWWKPGGGYKGSNACNRLEGTDGQQFHPDVKKDEKLWIFSTDLCRSMFLTFQEEVDVEGIPAYRFAPPVEALQANTTDNVGFCMEVEKAVNFTACIKETADPNILDLSDCFNDPNYQGTCHDGILNITRCMENAPVIISSPHYYQNPSEFLERIVGVSKPDPSIHETRLDIEPTTGMVIRLHKRIQINIPVLSYDKIGILKDVQNNTVFPILWVDEGADIDEPNVDKIKKMLITPTKIVIGVQWVCVVAGAAMILGLAFVLYKSKKSKKSGSFK